MRELEHLLPELAPPYGGLQRLQRSLNPRREPKRARVHRRWPAMAGVFALGVLALAWIPGKVQHERRNDAMTQALLRAAIPPPLIDGIQVDDGAALLLPNGQANARIYLIASSPAGH